MAFLLKHDSVGRTLKNEVKEDPTGFSIDGKLVKKLEVREPAEIPWGDNGVDIVIESTGLFTGREAAGAHLKGGAKRVVISAPSGDADAMICMGVNDDVYDAKKHTVISNASCTTNCLAPIAKVLNDSLGIERGLMTTIHSYTNDQKILDQIHKDMRRARAAAMSMITTTTGAARTVGEVLPELKGKLDGSSIRVPTPNVSVVDFTFTPGRDTSVEEVNSILKAASESGPLKGILAYTDEPLVSIDLNHDAASSTIDSLETAVLEGKLVRVLSWYDNEWGFSNRMVDTAGAMSKLG
jgi:glyceraldehyde 3-phosphate dehydrogenase